MNSDNNSEVSCKVKFDVDSLPDNGAVEMELVGPVEADAMLANRMDCQRRLKPTTVNNLVNEIEKGKWKLTSDAICIVAGRLANGQHRLEAIKMTGKTLPFLVYRTDDEEIYSVLDCGNPRQVADVLRQRQYSAPGSIAAAARIVLNHDWGFLFRSHVGTSGNCRKQFSRSDLIEFIDKNKGQFERLAAVVKEMWDESHLMTQSYLLAFLFMGCRNAGHEATVTTFLREVVVGGKTMPMAALFHTRLLKDLNSSKQMTPGYRFGLLIKSWRLTKEGKVLRVLKIKSAEEYPTMP